jgi:murein DD-endopeptidase MepM/ murein hydrolase activator NlpD
VAEVKLQHCKLYEDNKDWLSKLKNGFHDNDNKTAQLYIKVRAIENVFTIVDDKRTFLKSSPFKMIGNNWHEPVDDPQIALWNSEGYIKPQSNTFGTARGRLHTGLDIFALEKSNVYACLDGTVYRKQWHGGYGWTITIKLDRPVELKNRKKAYTHAYKTDKNSKPKFNEDDTSIYLFYAHLKDILVKK